jgi:ferritin
MISKDMTKAINEQINKELYSAYLYKAMGLHAKSRGFGGTAVWMALQEAEEISHAAKFEEYLLDQGERVVLDAIARPESEFGTLKEIFQAVLEHEKKVTASILDLVKIAQKENDIATGIMLQWFVSEQVEEEKNPADILQKIELVGTSAGSLYLLDREIGKRAKD